MILNICFDLPEPNSCAAYIIISLESPVKPMSLAPCNELRSSSNASANTLSVAPSRNLVSNKNDTALVVITAVAVAQS